MTDNTKHSVSAASLAESATADASHPPAASSAVAHLIIATHRTIAEAHAHGRKAVTLRDTLIAQLHFAIARRLARLAWRFAMRGKGRVS